MPNWGLTDAQREQEPWGLDPGLLAPCKTVTDPVHKDVYLTQLEALLVDSRPMQRLRRVRQLGTTHLIYPGATHSRLSHALGTLRAAQDLLDAVWNSRDNPQADTAIRKNRLTEWADAGTLDFEFAQATVLARLGALLHDLCHVPLGHTIEDDLQVLVPHDKNEKRFQRLWNDLDPRAREAIESADGLLDELRVLIISKDEHARTFPQKYPFAADIVGNTICADLIDYIRRDHHNTGLPLALGTRFMDSFFVVPSDHPHYAGRMVIGIERDGMRRNDIVSELVKYLRYRYELTERVLAHHAKTAADAMLGKMLELWRDDIWMREARAYQETKDGSQTLEIDSKATVAEIGQALDSAYAGAEPSPSNEVAARTQEIFEEQFISRSDDGLLEYIRESAPGTGTSRGKAVSELADKLLNRDLFKILGHAAAAEDQAVAEETYNKFAKDPEDRRRLEQGAARFAGLDHGWEVVVWLPNHEMRLKVADVLVQSGTAISPLSRVEPTSESIVKQHQRLWGVTVYAPVSVRNDPTKSDAILAYLGDKTKLTFRRPDGSTVPGKRELAVDRFRARLNGDKPSRSDLLELVPAASDDQTFQSLYAGLVESAVTNGLVEAEKSAQLSGN